MTDNQRDARQQRAETQNIIVTKTNGGYRAHSAESPSKYYSVVNTEGRWTCTCPDFEQHKGDARFTCKHIFAVLAAEKKQSASNGDTTAATAGRQTESAPGGPPNPTAPQMRIQLLPSADGKSFQPSVEIRFSLIGCSRGQATQLGAEALEVMQEILKKYLATHPAKPEPLTPTTARPGKPPEPAAAPNLNKNSQGNPEAVRARMTGVGQASNGKLFINFKLDGGQQAKLFGSAQELKKQIGYAGHQFQGDLESGVELDIPCRVLTTTNGKYLNVKKVLADT